MNYENASNLRLTYLRHINTTLTKSTEFTITDIVILPIDDGTLLAYTGHIKRYYPVWLVTSFDHEFIYKQSGIYILYDGRVMPDNLTLYALLKNNKSDTDVEYKSELLINLLIKGEIEGIEDLHQQIEQLQKIQ